MHLMVPLFLILAAQAPGEAVLAQDGASDWVIVVAEDAQAAERTAARSCRNTCRR